MAILTFPNIIPDTLNFGIKYKTQISASSISGLTQTVELPGARWSGDVSFRDLTPIESSTLKAFLLELRGSSGRFYYGDVSHTAPFNTVSGTLTIAAGSTPRLLRVTYADANRLVPGDYVQVGTDTARELKMVVGESLASSPYTYDVQVESLVRRTDYIGKELVYTAPTGVFLLSSDDQAKWGIRSKALLSDLSLNFIEV